MKVKIQKLVDVGLLGFAQWPSKNQSQCHYLFVTLFEKEPKKSFFWSQYQAARYIRLYNCMNYQENIIL